MIMASPDDIVALEPDNMPIERGSKKQKMEESPGGMHCRSSDEIQDNKQDAEDSNDDDDDDDDDDDYNVDHYDGDEELMNQYKLMYKQAQESEVNSYCSPLFWFRCHRTAFQVFARCCNIYADRRGYSSLVGQVKKCLAYAIEDHNKSVKDDEKIELLNIVKALATGCSVYVVFITINARLLSTKEDQVYQIRVVDNMIHKKIEVDFVRPKPGQ